MSKDIKVSTTEVTDSEAVMEDMGSWLTYDEASTAIANVMMRFSATVANEQGACDSGTMDSLLQAALARWDENLV